MKYRRVYDLVADNVAGVYARLLSLCQAVEAYVKEVELDSPPKEEQLESLAEAYTELQKCLLPNRIHLPPGLYERTKELAGSLREIADEITKARRLERDSDMPRVSENTRNEMNERAMELWSKAQEDFRNSMHLLDALVADYQNRLGIQDDLDYKPTRAKLEVTARFSPAAVTVSLPPIAAVAQTEEASATEDQPRATTTTPAMFGQRPDTADSET